MRIILFFPLLLFISITGNIFSQGMGISDVSITPNASSVLELRSTTTGLLIPRMTAAQKTAMDPLPEAIVEGGTVADGINMRMVIK